MGEMLPAATPEQMYRTLTSICNDPGSFVSGSTEAPTTLSDPSQWLATGDVVDRMMYIDGSQYLPDDILVKVDRASMAVALEARVPLLDHRIAEFAWRLPRTSKVRDGRGKWILRALLDRYVPSALIERPKMGFGVPIAAWLRGPLREWADTLLDEHRLAEQGIFEPGPVRRLWEDHLAGAGDHRNVLWGQLMFQAWLDKVHAEAAEGQVRV
jgi:asparagine synthase (glutamine-hydrolysing)